MIERPNQEDDLLIRYSGEDRRPERALPRVDSVDRPDSLQWNDRPVGDGGLYFTGWVFGARIEKVLAGVTQLVEFLPSKQVVAGSSPVSRSINPL